MEIIFAYIYEFRGIKPQSYSTQRVGCKEFQNALQTNVRAGGTNQLNTRPAPVLSILTRHNPDHHS